ncbi:copper amine oxidase [Bacillus toyonensis]|uniref:Copper amine oxidase n=1 Tax=Bacillus toyonensis TaxID=155322 RepID=A0AB36TA78_9BACI|nr:copper amine oxidase [Bacillus toyonensis]PEN91783.1 copper amine oxidase [Bacillus toyonensis]
MKKLKMVSALALSLSLFVPSLSPVQAVSTITYTQTGANYMYSNSPETIKGKNDGYEHRFENGKYSFYTLQRYTEPNKEYVGEFYNHNNSGTELQWGYAIYNGSSSARTVTIKNDSFKQGTQPNGNTMNIASQMEIEYANDTKIETKTIPAWSSIFIKEQKVTAGNTTTGKIKFITDGNLTVRQFVSKKKTDGTYPTATEVMDLTKTPQVYVSTSDQTTANYKTDTRKATIDYNTTKSFYVGSNKNNAPQNVGINEYETPIDQLANTASTLDGNYGIVYEFTFKNAAGKKIRITPNYYKGTASTFVYYDGTWKQAPKISSGTHEITVPANGVIKYILPGGTNASKLFEFIN